MILGPTANKKAIIQGTKEDGTSGALVMNADNELIVMSPPVDMIRWSLVPKIELYDILYVPLTPPCRPVAHSCDAVLKLTLD